MFAATGSTRTAAISFGWVRKISSTESTSLYSATSVSRTALWGTPAEADNSAAATPDPALTRSASACP